MEVNKHLLLLLRAHGIDSQVQHGVVSVITSREHVQSLTLYKVSSRLPMLTGSSDMHVLDIEIALVGS